MKPDYFNDDVRVWRTTQATRVRPGQEANVESWIINGTFAATGQVEGEADLFQWWLMGVVDLRDIPGVAPAYRMYPEAQFELMVGTIDPEHYPVEVEDAIAGRTLYRVLTPLDVQWQWHGTTNEQASQLGNLAIQAIMRGELSPNAPAHEPWATLFKMAWYEILGATLDHIKTGHWPAQPQGRA